MIKSNSTHSCTVAVTGDGTGLAGRYTVSGSSFTAQVRNGIPKPRDSAPARLYKNGQLTVRGVIGGPPPPAPAHALQPLEIRDLEFGDVGAFAIQSVTRESGFDEPDGTPISGDFVVMQGQFTNTSSDQIDLTDEMRAGTDFAPCASNCIDGPYILKTQYTVLTYADQPQTGVPSKDCTLLGNQTGGCIIAIALGSPSNAAPNSTITSLRQLWIQMSPNVDDSGPQSQFTNMATLWSDPSIPSQP